MKRKTRVKKILTGALAAAVFLSAVPGCRKETGSAATAHYTNQWGLCQLGDTIYDSDRLYGAMSGKVLDGRLARPAALCHDPLCDHTGICPESERFTAREFVTDGVTVCMEVKDADRSYDYYKATGVRNLRVLYAFRPEDPDSMRELAAFEGSSMGMRKWFTARDGYVYYKTGVLREGADGSNTTEEDWTVKIMRVGMGGGTPELFLDRDLSVGEQFEIDGSYYYILSELDENGGGTVERVPLGGGETEFFRSSAGDMDGRAPAEVIVTDAGTFLLCWDVERTAEGEQGPTRRTSYAICSFGEEGPALLAGDAADVIFSGGFIWYSTPEIVFRGTLTFAPGAVTAGAVNTDVFSYTAGDLVRLDPGTGQTSRWTADGGLHIEFIGYSGGYALAYLIDYEEYGRTGERDETVYKLALNGDGTVTAAGTIGAAP